MVSRSVSLLLSGRQHILGIKRIIIHCWFALKGQPILAQGTALGIEIGNWK